MLDLSKHHSWVYNKQHCPLRRHPNLTFEKRALKNYIYTGSHKFTHSSSTLLKWTGVGPHTSKGAFFDMPLALSMPIYNKKSHPTRDVECLKLSIVVCVNLWSRVYHKNWDSLKNNYAKVCNRIHDVAGIINRIEALPK